MSECISGADPLKLWKGGPAVFERGKWKKVCLFSIKNVFCNVFLIKKNSEDGERRWGVSGFRL